ncbi:homoserine kinase [Demequina sp. TTPB684]|uniref:homoserine kinase n=1 Tax=unclassified Demequina TaxID=2620311 RepID=UPI001CF49F12|nr:MULTISPECIES: homoserine kinase [unclassified Demequina]MCB2412083.1 homoserine kinase [Demequina sp. TTPB684]UPU88628.1 homoserine kinase [Demequina sp. TMPB413]
MRYAADHVRVRVPATAGNLGPGFDALGMALGVTDEVEVWALGARTVEIEIEGEGSDSLSRDESHLIVRAIREAADAVGASHTGLRIVARNSIPHGRGLGSSAAAVVAGIAAMRGLIAEPELLGPEQMLRLATQFEGHPDNAAPAIYGGATAAWQDADGAHAVPLTVAPGIESAVLIPQSILPTKQARAVLPESVPHADAAFNVGRAALLVAALTGAPERLLAATEDRLHQDYRATILPAAAAMVRTLREQGLAAVVSGAGPSVLVLGQNLRAAGLETGPLEWAEGVGDDHWRCVHTAAPVAGVTVDRL